MRKPLTQNNNLLQYFVSLIRGKFILESILVLVGTNVPTFGFGGQMQICLFK